MWSAGLTTLFAFIGWLIDYVQVWGWKFCDSAVPQLIRYLPADFAAKVQAGWTIFVQGLRMIDIILPVWLIVYMGMSTMAAVAVIKLIRRVLAFVPFVGQGMNKV